MDGAPAPPLRAPLGKRDANGDLKHSAGVMNPRPLALGSTGGPHVRQYDGRVVLVFWYGNEKTSGTSLPLTPPLGSTLADAQRWQQKRGTGPPYQKSWKSSAAERVATGGGRRTSSDEAPDDAVCMAWTADTLMLLTAA